MQDVNPIFVIGPGFSWPGTRHQGTRHEGTRAPYMNLKHFCLSGGILVLKRTLSARNWV